MSETAMTDEEFEEMFCRMMVNPVKKLFPKDFEDSPEKVKVPVAFDKWYKQLKQLENKNELCDASEAAMFLISAQGHGYSAAGERNIMKIDFDLTGYEQNEMLYYIYNNKVEAMRAILDGYEIGEQLYVVRLPDLDPENNYINYDLDEDCFDVGCKWESAWCNPKDDVYVDQFPMSVIKERLPKYVQYAEKVEEVDD